MKRIVAFILSIILVVFCLPNVYAASDKLSEIGVNEAYAYLGENAEWVNFAKIEMGEAADPVYMTKGGDTVWCMTPNNGNDSYKMCFDIRDQFANCVSDGSTFDIEVEYYSEGQGYFQLIYDSQKKAERRGMMVYSENNNNWSKATISIDDAYFGNRVEEKYDFVFTIKAARSTNNATSASPMPIKSVRVIRHTAANPITHYGWIDETGNAFEFYKDEKIIHNEFTNNTDRALEAKVTYRALSTEGPLRWSKTQEISLAPNEVKTLDLNVDSDFCDLYTLYVDIEIPNENIVSHFKRFNFAIIKTDPDGIKNDMHFIGMHLDRYPETIEQGVEMIAKGNFGGTRNEFGWSSVETGDNIGSFTYPETQKRIHEALKANDLGLIAIFSFAVTYYTGGFKCLPETDAALKRWGEAMEYCVQQIGDWITGYEIWNEPNIGSFNGGVGGGSINVKTPPEGYGKAALVACEAAHKINPDLKVGVMSLCGLTTENSVDFFRRAMSTGL